MKTSGEMQPFGKTRDGQEALQFYFSNNLGAELTLTNFGGTLLSLKVPDKNGLSGDVLLGFDNLEDIEAVRPFYGCIIGRYGNRISRGQFSLNGQTYSLAVNNGPNHLHGGLKGFDQKIWAAEPFSDEDGSGVILRYTSKDGEEGYPGNLSVKVTYTLTNKNALKIDYEAVTDKTTVINLTNHAFFNLKDCGLTSILDHEIQLFADHFTPVNEVMIPTGEIRPVKGSPLDFSHAMPIGLRINSSDEQIRFGNGYDHNYVVNRQSEGLVAVAKVVEKQSGRVMEVFTTEPGVQFYTANYLQGRKPGKYGITYQNRAGFCLETQHFPDSPNQPGFPSTILKPGEVFRSTTVYAFSIEK
ncbi:MAG: aldose epimerase family protein [Bacteroidia bacterium]|nr:aldose epimerase family protein [Bacteroidia bacterium]